MLHTPALYNSIRLVATYEVAKLFVVEHEEQS